MSGRRANLSLSEVVSLLGLADDDEVLAGTSEESRKHALWQFYSTGMLTHSHSDGEFPIYSQGEEVRKGERVKYKNIIKYKHTHIYI